MVLLPRKYTPRNTLRCDNLPNPIPCTTRKRRHSGLHPDFHSLQRTQTNIRDELCGGGSREVDICLVLVGILLSHLIGVELVEHMSAMDMSDGGGGGDVVFPPS